MKHDVFVKHLLFVLVLTVCCNALAAQTIRFKTDYTSTRSSSTLKFETASYSGTLSSSNTELVLKIKNKGVATWSSKQINLVDISNRGEKLCAEKELALAPGKKGKLTYVSCAPKRGLFRLETAYPSKVAFKEDAFFLRGKEWTLTVGGETFTFYTDI
ncbi:MAG: hypothetical protein ACPGYN_06135 [Schleiferiaceae bacterium]